MKKKKIEIGAATTEDGLEFPVYQEIPEIDPDLREYLDKGCTHTQKDSPIKDVCKICAEEFWRRCYTDIRFPNQFSECKKYFIPENMYKKYCPPCFEIVHHGFKYER